MVQPPTFENAVGAVLGLVALGVVGYLAITGLGDARTAAEGALIAITSAATGFFLRAKVQPPTPPGPPG